MFHIVLKQTLDIIRHFLHFFCTNIMQVLPSVFLKLQGTINKQCMIKISNTYFLLPSLFLSSNLVLTEELLERQLPREELWQ